ncbi:hypothetical protein EK599_04500 [Vibrio sp. T187]|uniref:hypothetical protein n=1 Tax=Vibrio TaxID=662 RepID=UPI0010C956DC|nr:MULTISPECIES: hypothetical protein [Vibrio]MBW3694939.1 hypothetical protein [Vibrio sp. T187]
MNKASLLGLFALVSFTASANIDHLRPYYQDKVPSDFLDYMDSVTDISFRMAGIANYGLEHCDVNNDAVKAKVGQSMVGLMFYIPQEVIVGEIESRTGALFDQHGNSYCSKVEKAVNNLYSEAEQLKVEFEKNNPQ